MPGNRVLINAQDYTHIRMTETHQIRYWTGRFSVTESQLVELVGTHGSAVATIVRVLSSRVEVSPERPPGNG